MALNSLLTKTKSQKARARAQTRTIVPKQVLSGSGAYSMKDIKSALRPVLKEALLSGGSALGTTLGGATGGMFGRQLAGRLSKIIGSGDYETNTSVNALVRPSSGIASASFGADTDVVRVRRREFLGDILAPATPGTFSNNVFPLNAGMRVTFPFLSQMAANYEEFCFDGLVFEFISSASPYIANSALGTVIAAMEYNAAGPPFSSKYTMENSAHAISARLDKNLVYGVECAKGSNAQNCYYTRSGTSVLPITTTDLGLFQLAVATATTVPASSVLGELWVTYDVCLKRPVLQPSRYSLYHRYASTCAPLTPLGVTTDVETTLGAATFKSSSTQIAFSECVPGDVFLLSWWMVASVNAAAAPTIPGILLVAPSANITVWNGFQGDSAAYMAGGQAAGGAYVAGVASLHVTFCFQVTASSGVIAFGTTGTNWPSGTTYVETLITPIGNGVSAKDF